MSDVSERIVVLEAEITALNARRDEVAAHTRAEVARRKEELVVLRRDLAADEYVADRQAAQSQTITFDAATLKD